MTCSDEELQARSVQAETREEAYRRKRAAELGMHSTPGLAWFSGNNAGIELSTLMVYLIPEAHGPFGTVDEAMTHLFGATYGPFGTVDEAVNMLILLGGGPK